MANETSNNQLEQALTMMLFGGFKNVTGEVTVKREGKQIIIPEDMNPKEAMEWLARKDREDNTKIGINEVIDTYPLEGAVALYKAVKAKYGFVSLVNSPSFFGPEPPEMIGVNCGVGKTIQVPWGRMEMPSLSGYLETSAMYKDDHFVFLLTGQVKRKHEAEISALAQEIRRLASQDSIYRGHALSVKFETEDPRRFNVHSGPEFIDTSGTNSGDLVFSDDLMEQVQANLFVPIQKSALCRANKIPLGRKLLLEGPYGTGKSLTSAIAAQLCVNNNWTFIEVEDPTILGKAIEFARAYQPALVFVEDIDSVITGERDADMNNILNTIDGVRGKSSEVMIVLTTNHPEMINKAMLRPGRIDAILSIRPPDFKAVARLIKVYGQGVISSTEDITEVAKRLEGQIPATIAETVRRAKLWAVRRSHTGVLEVTSEDLIHAANSMKMHLDLLAAEPPQPKNPLELLGKAAGEEIAKAIAEANKPAQLSNGAHKKVDHHKEDATA